MVDGTTLIFITFYFDFISHNWIYFQYFGFSINAIVTVALFFLPESPAYYHGYKRYDEARTVFNIIAKANGTKRFTGMFELEKEELDRGSEAESLLLVNINKSKDIVTELKNKGDVVVLKGTAKELY
jgi:hypothetical protein